MAHDVFISYATIDKAVADAACATLESSAIRCWIAPRDSLPGTEYSEALVNAIESSRTFVLIFSAHADASPQVRREVERAMSKGKIIVPFRIEDVLPSKAMEYCLSNTHWLDALTPPLELHLRRLRDSLVALLGLESSMATNVQQAAAKPAILESDDLSERVADSDAYEGMHERADDGAGAKASTAIADRNLLFGIIALQTNFITREQLVAAFDSWVQEKSLSLAEILERHGALPAAQREVMQKLVDMFLAKHGGDAEKSLAALSSVSLVRPDLEQLNDPDLGASLGHVGQDAALDPRLYETIPVPPTSKRSLGRFRILRPHAKGGLGQVSVALDQELNREVALKEIQPQHADDQTSRARFVLEAEITGGLEHPGIVPVYGLGQAGDGRPFYAMQFIKGDSLKEAIERYHKPDNPDRKDPGARQLALRQLLGRFIDVCNAMEYAHSRGVLHRDLKPGNIMVGKYGETLVVDWGLAKVRGTKEIVSGEATLRPSSAQSSSEHTQPGSAIGTPAYMSPEQAAGSLEKLGPASDVYSLGATLYHVLCGKPPFEREELAEIRAKVERGDFPKPRSVVAGVPAALEAICLKAMALRPADRYQTARGLADDIEHWLADEPVAAYQQRWTEQLGRWMRHHRSTAAVASLAPIVVMLTIAIVLLSAAHESEKKLRHTADENAENAVHQQQRAEHSFNVAHRAVDEYYTKVAESTLLNEPGMHDLRRDLLHDALNYYQAFLDERRNDPDPSTQDDYAAALFRAASIWQETDPKEAIKKYEEARLLEERLASQPGDRRPTRLSALGDTLNALGSAHLKLEEFDEALKCYQQAEGKRQELTTLAPDDAEFQRKLASTIMNMAVVHKVKKNIAESRRLHQRAQTLRQKRIDNGGQEIARRRDRGIGSYNLALLESDNRVVAAEHLEAARADFEAVLANDKRDFTTQFKLAICYRFLGDTLLGSGRDEKVRDLYARAKSLLEPLVTRNPGYTPYVSDFAELVMNMGVLELEHAPAEAEKLLLQARDGLGRLVADESGVPTKQKKNCRDLAITQRYLAEIWLERGLKEQFEQARQCLLQSRDHLATLLQLDPTSEDFAAELKNNEDDLRRFFPDEPNEQPAPRRRFLSFSQAPNMLGD